MFSVSNCQQTWEPSDYFDRNFAVCNTHNIYSPWPSCKKKTVAHHWLWTLAYFISLFNSSFCSSLPSLAAHPL